MNDPSKYPAIHQPHGETLSRKRTIAWGLTLSLFIVMSIGCGKSQPSSVASSDAPPTDTTATDPADPAEPPRSDASDNTAVVAPTLASLEEVSQHIKELGRPAVVDYWSLACQPCMDEFPGLVRLHAQHGDRVACIAVDVDFDGRKSKPPESYQEAVTEFLTEQQAPFTSFICTTQNEDVYAELDIISIPSVFVFAADGTIAKKFVDAGETVGFTYAEDVVPFVEELLAENN